VRKVRSEFPISEIFVFSRRFRFSLKNISLTHFIPPPCYYYKPHKSQNEIKINKIRCLSGKSQMMFFFFKLFVLCDTNGFQLLEFNVTLFRFDFVNTETKSLLVLISVCLLFFCCVKGKASLL